MERATIVTISELLQQIAKEALTDASSERVTIGAFMDKLAERGFGVAILLCALPNLFPVNIPGVSTVFSVMIALLAIQWMLGLSQPWLPACIRRKSFHEKSFADGLQRLVPRIQKLERWIRPRGSWMTRRMGICLAGIGILVQCAVLVLPLPMIPFSNAIPAFFIAAMAIGILAQDGYLLLSALVLGTVVTLCLGTLLWQVAFEIFHRMLP